MALNPLIPLQARTPDAAPALNQLLQAVQQGSAIDQRRVNQQQNQLLSSQQFNQQNVQKIGNAALVAESVLPKLNNGDIEGAVSEFESYREKSKRMGIDLGIDDSDIQLLKTNPERAKQVLQQAIDLNKRIIAQGIKPSTGFAEFDAKARAAGLVPGTPEYEKAALVDLGLNARAGVTSKEERIAGDDDLTKKVADSQATIEGEKSGAKEQKKLNVQLELKPKIEAAVTLATEKAKGQGEAAVNLAQSQAALPGLLDVVDSLKELAPKASYTIGGRAFNTLVKEMGFGATEGATARSKFISIINNQVLPLLKPTFGAAFTVQEGETLKATMGDPNSTPEEKIAQLNAFIDNKYREIESKSRESGQTANSNQTNSNQTNVINWNDL